MIQATSVLFSVLLFSSLAWAAPAALPDLSTAVDRAIESNQKATSQQEWIAQGATPSLLFERIRALPEASARETAWKELCSKLNLVGTLELSIFLSEIEETRGQAGFECRGELLHRINSFYEVQSRHFRDGTHRRFLPPQNGALGAGLGELMPNDLPIPSKVRNVTHELDPAQVAVVSPGFMVGGATPPGKGPFMKHAGLGPKEICLTFDDGPAVERTIKVLDALDAADVRVNFFEVGHAAETHPELSAEVARRGHIVGSHSMTHPILSQIGFDTAKHEILDGRDAVAKASGGLVDYFRFPGGGWNHALIQLTDTEGLATFFWDMDTRDWQIHDPHQLLGMALSELKRAGNGTILFHDTQPSTWVILPEFLNNLADKDYTVVQFAPPRR